MRHCVLSARCATGLASAWSIWCGERWIEKVISLTFVVSAKYLDCINENLIM